jgi:NitT/TauT family transport system permease protein
MKMMRLRGYAVTLAVIALIWQGASALLGSTLLPGPLSVLERLGEEALRPSFWSHALVSFFRICAGLAAAFVTAVPLGLALGSSRKLDRLFAPFVYLSYPVPKIVLLPVVLVLFGLGDTSKIVLIAMIIFFQLLITTRDSSRQIEAEVVYSLKSIGGGRWDLFRHVVWPVSLPGIFTSLRIGTGTAVAVLFFVESIGTRRGLGLYIIDSWGRADYTAMFVGITAMSVMGILLYEFFDLLEKKFCLWKEIQSGATPS